MPSAMVNILALLAAVLWMWGCSSAENQGESVPPPSIPRTPASVFELKDTAGNLLSSSQLTGKWVVVNIWATWSPHSAREIPELIQLHRKWENGDAVVIGLAVDERGEEEVKPFLQRMGVNYPVACVDMPTIRRLFGEIDAIPTTFIIDPTWRLANRHTGYTGGRMLENEIKIFKKEAAEAGTQ